MAAAAGRAGTGADRRVGAARFGGVQRAALSCVPQRPRARAGRHARPRSQPSREPTASGRRHPADERSLAAALGGTHPAGEARGAHAGLRHRCRFHAGAGRLPGTFAMNDLPNRLPRPAGELQRLERAWAAPTGWRLLSAVNNTHIGLFYIAASLVFFVLAGVLGLLIRAQLAVPDNNFLSPALYNQIFTMHGTVMMFVFAVPVVEAIAVYLLPGMLGARDLPFPRLSAYAFWE